MLGSSILDHADLARYRNFAGIDPRGSSAKILPDLKVSIDRYD